jgi:hypothetical protein
MELYYNDYNGYPTSNGTSNGDVPLSDPTLNTELVPKYIPSMPALLVADGDHYYGGGVTSGVGSRYDLYVYIARINSACTTGSVPNTFGDWGNSTPCNF